MIFVIRARVFALLGTAAIFVAFSGVEPVGAVDSGASSGSSGGSSTPTVNISAEIDDARKFIRLGRYSSAIRALRVVVQQDGQNADAYNLLGFASRKLERTKDAAKYYATALKIKPDHLGALEYQGELFLMLDQLEKANANLAKLLRLCGDNCHEYLDLKTDIASHQGS